MMRAVASFLLAVSAAQAWAQTTQPDAIEQRVRTVLAAMRSPAANGVLITELGSAAGGSMAAEAEAREGDIITHYQGRRVNTFEELREAVAEAIASKETNPNVAEKVLLGVKRGEKELVLQVRRGPLGLRGVNAQAGVRLEPNPVATPRGEYKLHWTDVPAVQNELLAPDDKRTWLRVERDGKLIAVESLQLMVMEGGVFQLQVGQYVIAEDGEATSPAITTVRFGAEAERGPAMFVSQARFEFGDSRLVVRKGSAFKLDSTVEPTRNEAVPAAALPMIAAALPQRADVAVPVSVFSVDDVKTRAGYMLVTRGEQKLGEKKAWQVDLLLFGVPIERYWLSAAREILRVDVLPGVAKSAVADKRAAFAARTGEGQR